MAALQSNGKDGLMVSVLVLLPSWRRKKSEQGSIFVLGDSCPSRAFCFPGKGLPEQLYLSGRCDRRLPGFDRTSSTAGQVYLVNQPIALTSFIQEMVKVLGVKPPLILPEPIGSLAAGLLKLSGRFASLYNRTYFSMEKLPV